MSLNIYLVIRLQLVEYTQNSDLHIKFYLLLIVDKLDCKLDKMVLFNLPDLYIIGDYHYCIYNIYCQETFR